MQLFTEEFMERAMKKTAYREGKMEMLFDLVSQGQITDDVASASIRMPVADFKQRMAEYNSAQL